MTEADPRPILKAAKLTLVFGEEIQLSFLKEGISFQEMGISIRIVERLTSPEERTKGWVRARVTLEPFDSIEEAIAGGYRLADALFSFAVSQKISFTFEPTASGSLVEVVDYGSRAVEARGGGWGYWPIDAPEFTELLRQHWRASTPLSEKDRTSLAFFSSAQMEVSSEARFILLVTALESFCVQITHPSEIEDALKKSADLLSHELGHDHQLVKSLAGQIIKLKRESVSQSLKRNLSGLISTQEHAFVMKAYNLRSKLLHEGKPISNIDEVNTYFRDILRTIYSNRFHWKLGRPVFPAPNR